VNNESRSQNLSKLKPSSVQSHLTAPDVANSSISNSPRESFRRSPPAPNMKEEQMARMIEQKARTIQKSTRTRNNRPNSHPNTLQSSIENLIGEWSSALKSIFPVESSNLNEDVKRSNLVLL
jgi:hypothetical protein